MGLLLAIAIAAALVAAAVYVVGCAVFPFANCSRCEGSGKKRSPSGRTFRLCRRCRGTGRRLRFGRRAWNYVRRLNREGSQ